MAETNLITSRKHSLVKELSEIRDDRESPLIFMEGPRLLQEVLDTQLPIEILVSTPSAENQVILKTAQSKAKRVLQVSDAVFRAISDVENPQWILAITRCPEWSWRDILKRSPAPIVILDGLQDPGNVATIVRTAEAADAAGVVTTPGTAHLFSPKALRGAMGSTLRVPCLQHVPIREVLRELKQNAIVLIASTLPAPAKFRNPDRVMYLGALGVRYTQVNWEIATAVIFGAEGKGVSEDWVDSIQETVFIPMRPPVESLNVGAAAALILYESFRRRAEPA